MFTFLKNKKTGKTKKLSVKINSLKKNLLSARNKKKTIILSSLVFLALALVLGRGLIFAAWVNGEPIYRTSVISEMENTMGDQVLESMITKKLIMQQARSQNIYVTEDEIQQEVDNTKAIVEKQGLTIEDALAMQGSNLDQYKESLRIRKTIEKLIGTDINITDQQIKDEFDKSKSVYGEDPKLDDYKDAIKDQLFQQELSSRYSKWISDLKAKSNVKYFVNY